MVKKVLLTPQVNDLSKIEYSWEGEVLTARLNGAVDTFDFTDIQEGDEVTGADTALPFPIVVSARRVNGVLEVVLLNFIGVDATHDQCFPDWMEVE